MSKSDSMEVVDIDESSAQRYVTQSERDMLVDELIGKQKQNKDNKIPCDVIGVGDKPGFKTYDEIIKIYGVNQ